MPTQPDRLKPPWAKKADRSKTFEYRRDEKSRAFYQGKKWKRFRRRVKRSQRKNDEKIAHEVYQKSETIPFSSYVAWLKGEDPLCVDCLEDGYIKSGNVADHQERIRAGGSPYDPDNIRWRCHHHHSVKSGKEAHEESN